MGRTLRGAVVSVRGLEESVQTCGHGEGAVARRGAGHAVWAHVREAGDRSDRGQFPTSEGASGAATRHASGSAGEETAAQTNRQSRSSERVYGEGLSSRTQSSVCASGGEEGGLPSSDTTGGGTRPGFLFRERAHDPQQRAGGGSEWEV